MNLFHFKKAQAHNYIAVVIFLFIFAFISIVGTTIFLSFRSAFQETGYYTGAIESTGERFLAGFMLYDYIIPLIMVILIIGIAITSFRLRTHPAFFIITVITGLFTGFVSYFFNFIFVQLVSDEVFTGTLVYFPRTVLICTNLHWVALVCLIIGSLTLYGKRSPDVDFVQR